MEVFVYGTLTDETTARSVLDEFEYRGSARLLGLQRVDGRYPTLGPGGSTTGRVLWTPERAALDGYEGVDRGLYSRLALPLERHDGTGTVEVYMGDSNELGAPVEWPGEGRFDERVRRYCETQDVRVVQR
jgi:gamma-glutamylcyclotransferase (GGCT)/AIG2-like uncharacterized protein YtfP